jgi:hypothetical protein
VGAEGAVPGHLWITHQDVLVELPPEQFVDPGLHTGVAAVELALVAGQGGMQALARRDHPRGQVGRKLAGAGLGGQVALLWVVFDTFVEEAGQAPVRLGLAGRPVLAQGRGVPSKPSMCAGMGSLAMSTVPWR